MTLNELLTNPKFWDVFGLPVFTFITILSVWMLNTNKRPDRRVVWMLLIIGILGLAIDGSILAGLLSFFGGSR